MTDCSGRVPENGLIFTDSCVTIHPTEILKLNTDLILLHSRCTNLRIQPNRVKLPKHLSKHFLKKFPDISSVEKYVGCIFNWSFIWVII